MRNMESSRNRYKKIRQNSADKIRRKIDKGIESTSKNFHTDF